MNLTHRPHSRDGEAPEDNLSARGRRLRRRLGWAGLLIGAALVAGVMATGASRWWRLLAALPFWLGALGLLQAKEKT